MELTSQIVAGVYAIPQVAHRSLENPNLPLNNPDIWAEVFGEDFKTDAGIKVSHKKALGIAALWQGVSLVSGDVAKLPLDVYVRRPEVSDEAREVDKDHPAWRLVRVQSNGEATAVKFWRRVMVHALLWNNAYIYIDRDSLGRPLELLTLLPDRTTPERHGGELYYVTEVRGTAGKKRQGKPRLVPVPAADVMHIEGISLDAMGGFDLLTAARHSWAISLAQQKFKSKFFANGGRIGGILELPTAMKKEARDKVEEGFRASYEGADNPFKTVILRENAKFHEGQVSPEGAQMVEAGEAEVRQVARWLNLAPSKLGLSDSVSYNSKSEDNQAYLDSTLSIWLLLIASECNSKLLTKEEQATHFFEHNTSALLRMNLLQRMQSYEIGRRIEMLSADECRARENMMPRSDGKGGDYENPNTKSAPPGEPTKEGEPPAKDDPPERAAHRRAVYEVTARAREKAKNPKAFLLWVDGGLAPHRAAHPSVAAEWFDSALSTLRSVADKANGDELAAAVNKACLKLEE